jgi:Ice-binding-like
MKLKRVLPIIAMLLIVFMGSCQKDNGPDLSSSTSGMASLIAADALVPNALTLPVVNLRLAGNFVILSKSGITDVYKSTITGDVGSSPITGAAILVRCTEVVGTIYSVNAAGPLPCRVTNASRLTTAVNNMQTAYTDAAGRSNPKFLNLGAGSIGGRTLKPGLYKWTSAVVIPTNVTISGGPNDVWIFQIAGTLKMSSAMKIILAGGAQAKNIFWQVAGAVTLGTTSHFEGIILGKTGINLQTGASINGRLLAQTAVTLQKNTVKKP